MARVTDYPTLATAVQAYLSRTDVGVSAGNLDYLCAEVEQELNTRLRVRRMLTQLTPTVSSTGVVTLPTDWLGWKSFLARDGSSIWELDLGSAEAATRVSGLVSPAGPPEALLMVGATCQITPFTNGAYTFGALYFAKVPELTSVATTNWVITNFPTAYLYGCLASARAFAKDDTPAMASRFDLWAKRFDRVVVQIQRADAKDLDARTDVVLTPDTTLFRGGSAYNVLADR